MSTPQSYSVELIDVQNPVIVLRYPNVIQDGVMQDKLGNYMPYRYLALTDHTRVEFPRDHYVVRFSPERALIAEQNRLRDLKIEVPEDVGQQKMN